jgi:hypothetical protein
VEKDLIRKFGRSDIQTGSLTNLTNGGEIGANGVVVSAETRLKLSEKVQERVEVIREQQRERWKILTEDEKLQRILNMTRGSGTPEHLAKLSKAQLKKWSNPEYKKRLSKIQVTAQGALAEDHRRRTTAYWANPENKEKRLEQNRLRRAAKLSNPVLSPIEERVAVPT